MFGRNPDKLDAKALEYEQKGKTAKAIKYREKAAKMRANQANQANNNAGGQSSSTTTFFSTTRSPQRYEQNALKWEQRGNWNKAQKNREKVWRMQNPQYGATYPAPAFYNNGQFLGYNVPYTGASLNKGPATASSTIAPAVVETHMHPTIVQQTMRPERILEVQPVVHREIEKPEVHIVEKHMFERVPSAGPGVITNAPLVQETVHPKIVEEIQPVVHREVPAPFIERVEQHVSEKVVIPTTTTKEVINDTTVRQPGMAAGGPAMMQQTTTTTTNTNLAGQQQQKQGPLQGMKNALNNMRNR